MTPQCTCLELNIIYCPIHTESVTKMKCRGEKYNLKCADYDALQADNAALRKVNHKFALLLDWSLHLDIEDKNTRKEFLVGVKDLRDLIEQTLSKGETE